MSVGDFYSLIANNKCKGFLLKLFGTTDLHSHIRLNPMIKFFDRYILGFPNKELKILELGCGSGVNCFEIAKITRKHKKRLDYIGLDIDGREIEKADVIARHSAGDIKTHFLNSDILSFLESSQDMKVDIILLMDVIEHLKDLDKVLELASARLKKGGIYIISVPTPLYPIIFGRGFHEKIGHLTDGFFLKDLDDLFVNKLRCQRLTYKYNTGLFSNIGCWLYYNLFNATDRFVYILKSMILYPFIFIDFFNSPRVSCTLFSVYKKEVM